jgi:hypothetical protein
MTTDKPQPQDDPVLVTASGRNARGKKDGEGRPVAVRLRAHAEGDSIDLDRAALVKRNFRRRDAGATLRAIAADLPAPRPRGGRWHPSSVAEVLANVDVVGGSIPSRHDYWT